jgi:LytS/YehU family sensor histidine kinase
VLLAVNLNYWYAWVLLTPIILWVARRFPLERGTFLRSAPVHLAGALVITLGHLALVMLGRAAIEGWLGTNAFGTTEFQRMFFLNFDWEMVTYLAIVGLSHARRYHGQAKAHALDASFRETRLMDAQLQTLRRQIQPDFLFNTLNTVSGLMHRDVHAADTVLVRLGRLFRRTIETVNVEKVALSHELDLLSDYAAIEQARFRDRLTIDFDIEHGTEECLVPTFLLQPLVENAISHSIGRRSGPGQVLVSATRVGDVLRLEVMDNDAAVDAARLSELEHSAAFSNTRSRLAHLYGPRHRLAVSGPPHGLSVQIELPVD